MRARTMVLGASLFLIGLLMVLTVRGAIRGGSTGLVVVSLLILGLLGIGVFGALTTPPEDDGKG